MTDGVGEVMVMQGVMMPGEAPYWEDMTGGGETTAPEPTASDDTCKTQCE